MKLYADVREMVKELTWLGLLPKNKDRLFYIYPVFFIILFFLLFLQDFIFIITSDTELEKIAINMISAVSYFHAFIKHILVLNSVKKFNLILETNEEIGDLYAKNYFTDFEKRNKSIKQIQRILLPFGITSGTTWFLGALLWPDEEAMIEQNIEIEGFLGQFPITTWMPLKITSKWIFYLWFSCVASCMLRTGLLHGTYDPLLMSILSLLAQHYITLGKLMRQFNRNNLLKIYRYHTRIMKLTQEVEAVAQYEVFFQCCSFVIILCFMGFVLTQKLNNLELDDFKIIVYILTLLFQLFLSFNAADEVQRMSMELPNEIYLSDWASDSEPISKDMCFALQMIIHRCQRSIVIKSTPFITMNRENFLSIVQMAFSYIMILKNVNEMDVE